ncbi:MAG: LemA family protein [Opitutales bacterium]|jgi:LemA protein
MNTPSSLSRNRGGAVHYVIITLMVMCILALLVALAAMRVYNKVQAYDVGVDTSWAQVETALQRRFDLIPNLVETVKGYAGQEKDVLTEVTRLRSQWGESHQPEVQADIASRMEGALSRLMVIVENYPDLKSNQNFLALQSQIEGTENRVSVERRRYNEALQSYNTYVRQFPGRFFGQPRDAYFKADEGAAQAPKVKFD